MPNEAKRFQNRVRISTSYKASYPTNPAPKPCPNSSIFTLPSGVNFKSAIKNDKATGGGGSYCRC